MRRLLIPAIILVIAFIVWAIQSNYEKKRISGVTIENFLNLEPGQINRMVITTPSEVFEFKKDDPVWFMKGESRWQMADMVVIANVIKTAASISVDKPFSENPDQQELFKVDTTNGILAQFFKDDSLLASIIIGKLTNDNAHTYIRKPGSNQVYTSDKILTFAFDRSRTQWLDKTIFAVNPKVVKVVELEHAGKTFRISLSDSTWYLSKKPYSDSLPADTSKVITFLRNLCYLRGSDFSNLSDSGLINFEKPSLKIRISTSDSTVETADFSQIIDQENGRYYVRRPERMDTLVISKPIYDNIALDFAGFLP